MSSPSPRHHRPAVDLSTRYLGLALDNPLIASPSPLSHTLDGLRRLADGGVGAIVMHSLFEEQLREQMTRTAAVIDATSDSSAEALDYFPLTAATDLGPRPYLQLLERAASTVGVPVIASLNCATTASWSEYARALQTAGAAAIELNIYFVPDDPLIGARELEHRHVQIVERVNDAVTIPVAVKLSPYFSAVAELAERLEQAGADGLVLFNRFLLADIDPEQLTIVPRVTLSLPDDGRVPRFWIAALHGRVGISLAASGGVEVAADVAAYLLAGADVVMSTSALLRHGPGYGSELLDGLRTWMRAKGFSSVRELRGQLARGQRDDDVLRTRAGYAAAMRAANGGAYAPW